MFALASFALLLLLLVTVSLANAKKEPDAKLHFCSRPPPIAPKETCFQKKEGWEFFFGSDLEDIYEKGDLGGFSRGFEVIRVGIGVDGIREHPSGFFLVLIVGWCCLLLHASVPERLAT